MRWKRPPALLCRLALEVREWAEAVYTADVDGNLTWNDDLQGACAVTSFRLWEKMKAAGFRQVEMVHGYGHAFLLWNDWLIDVTATQFGKYPRVLIWKKTNRRLLHKKWWEGWKGSESKPWRCRSRRAIMKKFCTWPEDQHPTQFEDCLAA